MSQSTSTVFARPSYTDEEKASLTHAITSIALFHPNGKFARTDDAAARLFTFVHGSLGSNKAAVVAFAVMNWLETCPDTPIGDAKGIFDGFDMKAVRAQRKAALDAESQAVKA